MNKTCNPHLNILNESLEQYVIRHITDYMKRTNKSTVNLLDVGGGRGWGKCLYEKPYINYHALDLNCQHTNTNNITFITGDITDKNLQIEKTFDIIFTKDTFEHILNPWDSTENILNLLCDEGLFIFMAPFIWRYHASPYDTYRYSHTGAQYMFERLGGMKKIESGYKICPKTKGFWANKKDFTPQNNVPVDAHEIIYIGSRQKGHNFNIEDLDKDIAMDHSF